MEGKPETGIAGFPLQSRTGMAGKATIGTTEFSSPPRTGMERKPGIGMVGFPLQSRTGRPGFPLKARTGVAGKARIGMTGFTLQLTKGMAGLPLKARAGVVGKERIGIAGKARIGMAGFPLQSRIGIAGLPSKARPGMAGKERIGMAGFLSKARTGMVGFPLHARTGIVAGFPRLEPIASSLRALKTFLAFTLPTVVACFSVLSRFFRAEITTPSGSSLCNLPTGLDKDMPGSDSYRLRLSSEDENKPNLDVDGSWQSLEDKNKPILDRNRLKQSLEDENKPNLDINGLQQSLEDENKPNSEINGLQESLEDKNRPNSDINKLQQSLEDENKSNLDINGLQQSLEHKNKLNSDINGLQQSLKGENKPNSDINGLLQSLEDRNKPDLNSNRLQQSLEDEKKPNSDINGLQQSLQDKVKPGSDSNELRQSAEDENKENLNINRLEQSLADKSKSNLNIDGLQQRLEDTNKPDSDSNGLQQSLEEKEHDSDNSGSRLGLERGDQNSAKVWQWKNAVAQLKQESVLDALSRRVLAEKVHLKYTATYPISSRWEYHPFTNSRNQTLFTQSWRPAPEIGMKAILILLHGLNEHSGRYFPFARQLNLHGYGVFAMDWIGHGGSDGLHGYVASLDHVVTDTRAFVSKVTANNPGVPCFLFGHSTGASIILKSSLECSMEEVIDGVILTSPALHVRPAHAVFGIIAPLLSLLLPTLQLKGANKRGIPVSRDPAVLVDKYTDPLVYTGPIRIRTGSEVLRISAFLHKRMRKVMVPFLVLHGTADTITDPLASLDLYNVAASQHKNIKLYEGLLHDLLFEPEREEITCDIIQWVEERLKHRLFHSPCQIRTPDCM